MADIDFMVCTYLPVWIEHFELSEANATFMLNYTEMRSNPLKVFTEMVGTMEWPMNQELLQRAIEMSSFDSIKKMGRSTGESSGMAQSKKSGSNSEHARSGKEEQFRTELHQKTIDKAFELFPRINELYGLNRV